MRFEPKISHVALEKKRGREGHPDDKAKETEGRLTVRASLRRRSRRRNREHHPAFCAASAALHCRRHHHHKHQQGRGPFAFEQGKQNQAPFTFHLYTCSAIRRQFDPLVAKYTLGLFSGAARLGCFPRAKRRL